MINKKVIRKKGRIILIDNEVRDASKWIDFLESLTGVELAALTMAMSKVLPQADNTTAEQCQQCVKYKKRIKNLLSKVSELELEVDTANTHILI